MQVVVLFAARAGARQPTGALFDVVLLLHVASVAVGVGTLGVSAVQGWRLWSAAGSPAPIPETLLRYYRPGANWAGRTLYGVPVFGLALVGLSGGAFGLGTPWIDAGLGIWAVGTVAAEAVLWPAERRIGHRLGCGDAGDAAVLAGDDPRPPARRDDERLVGPVATALVGLFAAAVVLMVAQP
ncbi:MAG: hypothetical protein ACYCU7_15375 [Acidimicrobiales bacterium]